MKTADTVMSIMQLIKAEALPDKPVAIDLRFFRKIYLADTYNGGGCCLDGVEYSAILYGNRVVWQSAIYRDPNNMRHRQPFDGNNELYYKLSGSSWKRWTATASTGLGVRNGTRLRPDDFRPTTMAALRRGPFLFS